MVGHLPAEGTVGTKAQHKKESVKKEGLPRMCIRKTWASNGKGMVPLSLHLPTRLGSGQAGCLPPDFCPITSPSHLHLLQEQGESDSGRSSGHWGPQGGLTGYGMGSNLDQEHRLAWECESWWHDFPCNASGREEVHLPERRVWHEAMVLSSAL